jgi:hypothetical protein
MSFVTEFNFMVIGHRVGVGHGHVFFGHPTPSLSDLATATGDASAIGWDRPMRFPMTHDPMNPHHVSQCRWWVGRCFWREVGWVVSWCPVHVLVHVVFWLPPEAWYSGSHVGHGVVIVHQYILYPAKCMHMPQYITY